MNCAGTVTDAGHNLEDDAAGECGFSAANQSLVGDIGAFQSEPPANTAPPQITGTAKPGNTLNCTTGTWTGDGQLSFAYAWLRDGAPIAGANSLSYSVSSSDQGHSLVCQVTATRTYGRASARSSAVKVALLAPKITSFHQSRRRWTEKRHRHSKVPMGTTFTVGLD
jgi:hypothetical protein